MACSWFISRNPASDSSGYSGARSRESPTSYTHSQLTPRPWSAAYDARSTNVGSEITGGVKDLSDEMTVAMCRSRR
jgi:hypothetical protein